MRVGVYGDVHLTKNMRTLQDLWDFAATESIKSMYDHFSAANIFAAISLGDFFDAPRLEAKHIRLVIPILDYINSMKFPTYVLLGNHEADSDNSNILEFLRPYENIIPVTETLELENMLFLPYYETVDDKEMKDKVVFTHHDIYGSKLAAGKTEAFFGINPEKFSEAALVMNGHIHTKSTLGNIVNVGSLLTSCHGELRVGDYPSYYILDDLDYETYYNYNSMVYLTVKSLDELDRCDHKYNRKNLVLRVEYDGELPNVPDEFAHVSYRKLVTSIETEIVTNSTEHFDIKNYLTDHINADESLSSKEKLAYISTGLELLS